MPVSGIEAVSDDATRAWWDTDTCRCVHARACAPTVHGVCQRLVDRLVDRVDCVGSACTRVIGSRARVVPCSGPEPSALGPLALGLGVGTWYMGLVLGLEDGQIPRPAPLDSTRLPANLGLVSLNPVANQCWRAVLGHGPDTSLAMVFGPGAGTGGAHGYLSDWQPAC